MEAISQNLITRYVQSIPPPTLQAWPLLRATAPNIPNARGLDTTGRKCLYGRKGT